MLMSLNNIKSCCSKIFHCLSYSSSTLIFVMLRKIFVRENAWYLLNSNCYYLSLSGLQISREFLVIYFHLN